jgi:multiple sugar transport system permease protein
VRRHLHGDDPAAALLLPASIKPTAEAATVPPTYFPHDLSLDSYQRLWSYQQGLPVYLANSLGTALLTILLTLVLTVPAAYALARVSRSVQGSHLRHPPAGPDRAVSGAADADIPDVRQDGLDQHIAGPRDPAHGHPVAVQPRTSAQQLRRRTQGARRSGHVDGASSLQALRRVFIPSTVPAMVTVALFAFIMSWNEFLGALVMMSRSSSSRSR